MSFNSNLTECQLTATIDITITNLQAASTIEFGVPSRLHRLQGGTGSIAASSGKVYYEATCKTVEGILFPEPQWRFGWSTSPSETKLGSNENSMGYCSTGKTNHGGTSVRYGSEFAEDDVIGCYVDFDARTISFSTNGLFEGQAFTHADFRPSSDIFKGGLYPAYCLEDAAVEFNFGATPFKFSSSPPQKVFVQTTDHEMGTDNNVQWKNSELIGFGSVTVSGLKMTSTSDKWQRGIGSVGIKSGQVYFEAKFTVYDDMNAACRIGWTSQPDSERPFGSDESSIFYESKGYIYSNGLHHPWGEPIHHEEVVGCYTDYDRGFLSYFLDGEMLLATRGMRASFRFRSGEDYIHPAFSVRYGASVEINFDVSTFRYKPELGNKIFFSRNLCSEVEFDEFPGIHGLQLQNAIKDDKFYRVLCLLKRKPDVAFQEIYGTLPIEEALSSGRYEIAGLLGKFVWCDLFNDPNPYRRRSNPDHNHLWAIMTIYRNKKISSNEDATVVLRTIQDYIRMNRWPVRGSNLHCLFTLSQLLSPVSRKTSRASAALESGTNRSRFQDCEALMKSCGVKARWNYEEIRASDRELLAEFFPHDVDLLETRRRLDNVPDDATASSLRTENTVTSAAPSSNVVCRMVLRGELVGLIASFLMEPPFIPFNDLIIKPLDPPYYQGDIPMHHPDFFLPF
jgi:SPRY domain